MVRKRRFYRDHNGNKLPSVTELLGGLGWRYAPLLAWANKIGREGLTMDEASRDARDMGTAGHDLIEAWLLNRREPERGTTPTHIWEGGQRALDSFQSWWEREEMHLRIEVLGTETMMVNVEKGYGGTADLVCLLDGKPTVLDYKTGKSIYAETAIQLAAYAKLWALDGCEHMHDADEEPLPDMLVEKRRKARCIEQLGIIHCPTDGRATRLVMIDDATMVAAGITWDLLVELDKHKQPFRDFAKQIRAVEKEEPEDEEKRAPF